jgi:hypothetical protein
MHLNSHYCTIYKRMHGKDEHMQLCNICWMWSEVEGMPYMKEFVSHTYRSILVLAWKLKVTTTHGLLLYRRFRCIMGITMSYKMVIFYFTAIDENYVCSAVCLLFNLRTTQWWWDSWSFWRVALVAEDSTWVMPICLEVNLYIVAAKQLNNCLIFYMKWVKMVSIQLYYKLLPDKATHLKQSIQQSGYKN